MNFNRLSEWSIKNPVPTVLMFVVLVFAGVTGYLSMRINNNPDVEFPLVSVTAVRPGAAPPELETQVTRYIEDAVAGLEGIRHVNSNVSDGVTNTIIEFEIGTDLEKATNDVRNAVASVRGDLPQDIPEPQVQRIDVISGELITYVVRTQRAQQGVPAAAPMNPEQLSWYVDNDISRRLLEVPGVSQVTRAGGVRREIRVQLDPARLSSYGVTAASISQQLRGINADLPGGRAVIGGEERSIRTMGASNSIEQLRNQRIATPSGASVRLSDLGSVEDAWAEPRGRARFNGEEVVTFGMLRSREGSEIAIAQAVEPLIAQIDRENPAIEIEEITSEVQYVEDSYIASIEALLLGAVLAVIVVFIFLRDWRATLIAAVAMPLSLIPTFAVLAPLGESINGVSLLALSLTIGILVDDAIVEIENIVRHMRGGKKPYPAAIEAADEIGLAVVATTFTIVAVFAPTGFMPGIVGQFFKAFALATCTSVMFSLLVARTITPLMGAYILKHDPKHEDKDPFWMGPYLKMLKWALKFRWLVVGLGTALFVGSCYLATMIPMEFFPVGDRARSNFSVELPPGATLEETDAVTQQVTRILRARPEVESVYASVGAASATGSVGQVRRANLAVNMVPKGERELSQQDFEQEIGPVLRQIPGVRVRFGQNNGPGDGSLSVTLVGDNPRVLNEHTLRVEREMRGVPGLVNVINTSNIPRPEILISPKPVQAAALGVTSSTLSQTVRVATLGDAEQSLPRFNLGDRQVPIRLTLAETARDDLDVLRNLQVPTTGGGMVPLSSVADITFGAGPASIARLDRSREATIRAELTGVALGQANTLVNALPSLRNLPAGVRQQAAGDVESLNEMIGAFIVAFATGILLMYAVLVLLFRSFSLPVTILTALPLAIGGAFAFLLIMGGSISLPSLIGILMLMGIAAKNSILFVDYVLVGRSRGMSRHDALIDAGHKRARPIIMTSMAMGVGMLPIALGFGADVEFRSPMAQAVVGGLISSTLLSLLYVPVAYTFVDDVKKRVDKVRGRMFGGQGQPGEATREPAPAIVPAE